MVAQGEGNGGHTRLDVSRWPVVVVTPPEGTVSDAHLDDFVLRFRKQVRGRAQPFATVLDVRHAGGITAKQRSYMAEQMRKSSEVGDFNCGTAMVMTSSFMRGLLTGLLWLRKPPYPVEIFASIEEGVEWCRRRVNAPHTNSVAP